MNVSKPYVPQPAVRDLLERFAVSVDAAVTSKEAELIAQAETAFMALMPCQLTLARRWYAPAARLLVLGTTRSGLSGTELTACRGIIVEARNALHEATARR